MYQQFYKMLPGKIPKFVYDRCEKVYCLIFYSTSFIISKRNSFQWWNHLQSNCASFRNLLVQTIPFLVNLNWSLISTFFARKGWNKNNGIFAPALQNLVRKFSLVLWHNVCASEHLGRRTINFANFRKNPAEVLQSPNYLVISKLHFEFLEESQGKPTNTQVSGPAAGNARVEKHYQRPKRFPHQDGLPYTVVLYSWDNTGYYLMCNWCTTRRDRGQNVLGNNDTKVILQCPKKFIPPQLQPHYQLQ